MDTEITFFFPLLLKLLKLIFPVMSSFCAEINFLEKRVLYQFFSPGEYLKPHSLAKARIWCPKGSS